MTVQSFDANDPKNTKYDFEDPEADEKEENEEDEEEGSSSSDDVEHERRVQELHA